ncbi:hypothetical protein P154DRAFT_526817 [Amniculicola lignicola CBS 123094]|uniref:Ferric oxidoreductase domain-containing protein n=1 Tax=Amniculicola lignicola CBS 123094 TaxID=1392246 RepID=A0A6A5W3W8_9PLEO|nr:hypothetical protein P154DRAFT_526817 [Amniculicola lignicola CBS 123094]
MITLKAIIFFLATAAAYVDREFRGRQGHGLIGLGTSMYDPPCAYACRDVVSGWTLDCDNNGGGYANQSTKTPSPACYATNDPFLQTLAWCISHHCLGISVSKLGQYWDLNVAGHQRVQPSPKYSYQVALSRITQPPMEIVDKKEVLTRTSLVDELSWVAHFKGNKGFEATEINSERFGLILIVTCTVLPIIFSLFRFLPLPQLAISKFYAYFIDPPVLGHHHAVPVLGLTIVPTRGQAFFIGYIWIINIVLSAVGYKVMWPNSMYSSPKEELRLYVANRLGVLAFVNLALTALYAGRNNILLRLTNWSHSTFLLIHRFIAVICTLQAALHSVLWWRGYESWGTYKTESDLDYWQRGMIATLALSALIPLSILPIRRRVYELFLTMHVVLAAIAMIGSLMHIYYRFQSQWGYEIWVWIAVAFWLFDRLLMRPLRLLFSGVKRAYITEVDEDYLQVTVPGLQASGHAYLYFPTLTWRVWENHPFSGAAIAAPSHAPRRPRSDSYSNSRSGHRSRRHQRGNRRGSSHGSRRALYDTGSPVTTFYVRRLGGMTRLLSPSSSGTAVLCEMYHGHSQSLFHSASPKPTSDYPNILMIAGGVGITAMLPIINDVRSLQSPQGNIKLFWGARTAPLVRSVEELLGVDKSTYGTEMEMESGVETAQWGNVSVTLSIGHRLNIPNLLSTELGESHGGTTVVVCGASEMADDVRCTVAGLARHGAVVKLIEESFTW